MLKVEKCLVCETRDKELSRILLAKQSADFRIEELERTVLGLKARMRAMQLDLRKICDGPLVEAADKADEGAGRILILLRARLEKMRSDYHVMDSGPEIRQAIQELEQLIGEQP